MAQGLNRAEVLGNLGADPELRMLNSGSAVLKMRIATTDSYLDRDRVRQERTEWHSIVVWGKRAEALAKFLSKGHRVYCAGQMRTTTWEDKDGVRRYRSEIHASEVILTGGGRDARPSHKDNAEPEPTGAYDVPVDLDEPPPGVGGDDEIPF